MATGRRIKFRQNEEMRFKEHQDYIKRRDEREERGIEPRNGDRRTRYTDKGRYAR